MDWRVIATTIYCDAMYDNMTIMAYKDWSTGYRNILMTQNKATPTPTRAAKKGLAQH